MDYFSPNFLFLFLIAVLVVTLRGRSKRKDQQTLPGKQIAIIGRKLETPLSKDTPYDCLLADGYKFGDGFKEKEEPNLPHNDNCHCEFKSFVKRNYDIFTEDPIPEPPHASDLGELDPTEARYYKYVLIANHANATEEDRASYAELAEQVDVEPEFRKRVATHLNLS